MPVELRCMIVAILVCFVMYALETAARPPGPDSSP